MAGIHSKLCEACGKVFYGYLSHIKKVNNCSIACGIHMQKERTKARAGSVFWNKVDIKTSDVCWEWKASKNPKGYGQCKFFTKTIGAHRVAYMLSWGDIPDGMEIMHSCDNRSCCNPAHLSVGTHLENINDMHNKKRKYTKLSEKEVVEIKKLLSEKIITQRAIAKKYNIHFATINAIAKNKIWAKINE